MVKIITHPLIQHKLSEMRKISTTTYEFRELVKEISALMVYEATRDLNVEYRSIQTPICEYNAPFIDGKKMVVVPILRAGLGMVDGILSLVPTARVGHIGMYRDEETLNPVEYFLKVPSNLEKRDVIIVDPMLATGGSVILAVDKLKEKGAKNLKVICLIASPEGVSNFEMKHPNVELIIGSLDEKLNDDGYIIPGLGDAGDRIFGTK